MRPSSTGRQRFPASASSASRASLSVVVVSSGSVTDGQKAARALKSASRDYQVQLIFVSKDLDPAFVDTVKRNGGEVVAAPAGSSRAEMCDLGMNHAQGMIVAVRDDVSVGNAQWMDAYRGVIPAREVAQPVAESIIMDSLVATRAPLADVAAPRPAAEPRARSASNEMAAAV
jgi:hypothetical protein